MLHFQIGCREEVDSRLLVVGSQTASLTPGPSFAYNLGCRCPNDQCEAIFDIYVSRPFQWHQEHSNARCFGPCCRALNIRESRRTPNPNFASVGLHPHTWPKWGCDIQHGLLPSWKHHPLSYKISTPLWQNLKQCLGTVTRLRLQPTSCVSSSKGHVQPSSTPQNSGSLLATSTGEKLPWLISFTMGFVTMFKIFCWHLETLLPSMKPSPRQFSATIISSNIARKRKSPPTPSFGTVALLRSP